MVGTASAYIGPLLALAAVGAATAQPITPPGASAPAAEVALAAPVPAGGSSLVGVVSGDRSYVLGIGDVVDVTLLGRTDFNTRARVGSDGAIVLPLVGAVPATGKSPDDLASVVKTQLQQGGFYANPQVRVEVVGVASRYVTVLGAVGTPGLVPLDRSYRLSEILARVGGRSGAGADYVVLTPVSGEAKRYAMEALATGSGAEDPQVQPGDKIYVPAASNQVFYVSGEVKTPGAYPIAEDLTVRMAIARGGGLTEDGSERRIQLYRGGKPVASVTQDTKIEAGDVITVRARLF